MYVFTMITKELIAASTEPILLTILGQGESYGYEIIKKVRTCSDEALNWSDGMLYPVLHRLEQKGAIASRWQKAGGRRRKYYRLTPAGRERLQQRKEEWNSVQSTLNRLWGEGSHV